MMENGAKSLANSSKRPQSAAETAPQEPQVRQEPPRKTSGDSTGTCVLHQAGHRILLITEFQVLLALQTLVKVRDSS